MPVNPILSICLPTYNQPNSIRAFFESIKNQLSSDIEILILDDSPNDDTGIIIREYASQLSVPIRYIKGEKSKIGGYDKALLRLTKEARGQYLWWYGDDVMAPDAILRITATINKNPNLSFIWLNSRDINNEKDPGLDLGGDKYFKNGSEIFEINVGLLGFP
ncbi:MAG: glycosyltransferase family 2 protein, partial [bacterium]|nr:glycosyltransferase family 2 protein [bacterium]